MSVQRSEIAETDRWNIEAIYPDLNSWEKELNTVVKDNALDLSRLNKLKGRLGESPEVLKMALEETMQIDRKLSNLSVYASLKHDEDIVNPQNKTARARISQLFFEFKEKTSWFEPELLSLSNETIAFYLDSPTLKDYKFYLEKIFRFKPYTLPAEQEELLALAGRPLQTCHKAFSSINDADFKFGTVKDSNNQEHTITHASYGLLIRSKDRTLRKNAFEAYLKKYSDFENTLCELLDGAVQRNIFYARARKFPSALSQALFPDNINESVYHKLIETVKANIKPLHDYYELRKKILKLDELHIYDMAVPITENLEIKMPYEQAETVLVEALKPLGKEYQDALYKGLKVDRWVDRYENQNKRSGAYSSGSYDTQPYILMNYKNILRDVFTLAHEAGHSMHSYYTHKHQPYQYGDYSIFLAEVASTFNEELLMRHLLSQAKSKEEKIYLINQKLEDIRGTLFRQTLFAEFELKLHTLAEQKIPLTPQLLKEEYLKLNKIYFGDSVVVDQQVEIEWSRIPHFYYNFYVFQYATGISASLALAEKVMKGNTTEREDYLKFLKSGSSAHPLEVLKLAGIDMSSDEPIKAAIRTFSTLTKELSSLIN